MMTFKLRNVTLSLARALLLLVFFAVSGVASAHNVLKASLPADGASLAAAPETVMLEFNGSVRLVKFEIERDGDVLEVGFKPDLNAAKSFTLPTPDLGNGAFSVTFSVIGEDGHTVAGHFGFGVGAAAPAASTGH